MAYTVPTALPVTLRAGDTATWRRSLADFPASSGWVISYILVKAGSQIAISAMADGDSHLVAVVPAVTNEWAAGTYAWQERASLAGAIHTTATGNVEILASFLSATSGIDARTHAQKTLAALESWIEGHDMAVAEYEISGRRMKYIPIAEVIKLRDLYRREVRAQSGRSGRVYMRF